MNPEVSDSSEVMAAAGPIRRAVNFFGQFNRSLWILAVGWLCWALPAGGTEMDLTWLEFLRPFLPLFAELMLFGTLALLLSMVLPSARIAGMATGGLMVANYLLEGLANMNEDLKAAVEYMPMHFYQGGDAIAALDWGWLVGLLGVTAALALLAWWRFRRRDIRVGGEGGWKLPTFGLRLRRGAGARQGV